MAYTALATISDASAGWGTLSYNGFVFPGHRSVSLTASPQYDDAGRVVAFSRYTLSVLFYITGSDDAAHAAAVGAMFRQLQEPGGVLRCIDVGFGGFTVNSVAQADQAVNDFDCEWGPKPSELQATPIGTLAHECVWNCTFAIKESSGVQGNYLAFNHGVAWQIADSGLQTRTIDGYLEIRLTRKRLNNNELTTANTPILAKTADDYRHLLRIPEIPGFYRTSESLSLTPDHRRLNFTIVDTQIEAEVPPINCVRCDADYEIENLGNMNFAQYVATLTAKIETPAGTEPRAAAQAFVKLFLDRHTRLVSAVGKEGLVLVSRFRFGRSLFTRRSTFACAWVVSACLESMFSRSGVWDFTPTKWADWTKSIEHPDHRGQAGLAYSAAHDALVDLNNRSALPPIDTAEKRTAIANKDFNGKITPGEIDPKATYLFYENALASDRQEREATHYPLTAYVNTAIAVGAGAATGALLGPVTGVASGILAGRAANAINRPQPNAEYSGQVVQKLGPPTELFVMTGAARRVLYAPEVPRLKAIGGQAVEEIRVQIDGPSQLDTCLMGLPVYEARWRITYRVASGRYPTVRERQPIPSACPGCEETQPSKQVANHKKTMQSITKLGT